VDFSFDVVLDSEPVSPEVVKPEKVKTKKPSKPKKKTVGRPPRTPASRKSSSHDSEVKVEVMEVSDWILNKRLVAAALRMMAEDMLPLSFVEGAGFRSFMAAIAPQHHTLSQHVVGMQLHEDVERKIKPQLIQDLQACLSASPRCGGLGAIHVTFDLWAGSSISPSSSQSSSPSPSSSSSSSSSCAVSPGEEPVIVSAQLHFVDSSWRIRQPTVAFRQLGGGGGLATAVARELEGVLLGYGLFPHTVGYVMANRAKELVEANAVFCDYKVMCKSPRGDPDADDLAAFLGDRLPEADESPFSALQTGMEASCVVGALQLVIREALKNSRVVENVLTQLHHVVAFFRTSSYWNQARTEAQDASSVPPLVQAKREQLVDILGLLQPFEEAVQLLQKPGVTISFVIPTLISLDKMLESRLTSYTHFSKALRTGLQSRLQPLILQRDLILATPFPDGKEENEASFLTVPSKSRIQSMLETVLEDTEASTSPAEDEERVTVEENTPKSAAESAKLSELEGYLSEPLLGGNSPLLFWKVARRFPMLRDMARKLLAIPATSGGFHRLYPIAASI
ncbi:hypothetical protein CRUP_009701, partial [Coryphaenoides rupestris]